MEAKQKYTQYPSQYKYQPYKWPPDLGLAQLHARCSQPGMADKEGVQCPCCLRWSKNCPPKWWKRSIHEDLKNVGSAIPGYFHLLIFYCMCITLMILVYSIYTTYAIYETCLHYDKQTNLCLKVGFLYYLQFNEMIKLLEIAGKQQTIQGVQILQTIAFYVMLFCNCFSIFFITFHNKSARQQIKQNKCSDRSRLLVFYNINQSVSKNFHYILQHDQGPLKIIKKIQLYQVSKYYQTFKKRNQVYYHILSYYTKSRDPTSIKKLNTKLIKYHQIVSEEKQKIGKFSNKIIIMFEDVQTKEEIHRLFKIKPLRRWYYGFRTVLKQLNIKDFKQEAIQPCSFRIIEGSDLKWQNFGEALGVRMASRIKAFFVCAIFIIICYLVLYYPMLFSLQTHSQQQQQTLTLFQKLLPDLVSLFLVSLSILFRAYLNKLSQQRNPKDQVQKSRFILIASITFHTIFFILMPTFFFLMPNKISNTTVKLYVISGQARIFMIIQLIIVIIDLPYKLWKSKQVEHLSNQKYAFRFNQKMLHQLVQNPDYPLEIRVDIMLRFWSFAILYTFLLPFMLIYMIIALVIIYWIQKHNLYKHYSIRKRISIRLLSQILIYFANFFAVLQCIIYSFNVQGNQIKITCAVIFTVLGMVINIVYWLVLNKSEQAHFQSEIKTLKAKSEVRKTLMRNAEVQDINLQVMSITSQEAARNQTQKLENYGNTFARSYQQFLNNIQNEELQKEISSYLSRFNEDGQQEEDPELRDTIKSSQCKQNRESKESSQQGSDKSNKQESVLRIS